MIDCLSPRRVELSIAVQKELEQRWRESDELWQHQLSQARYQSDIAKMRFMKVDPNHRLVADTLEADWNKALNALDELQGRFDKYKQQKYITINQEQQKKLLNLREDFTLIWDAPETAMQEKKQLIRLLVDDITLKKTVQDIEVHIRLKGGQTKSLHLPLPKPITELRKTDEKVIQRISELSHDMTDQQIATTLNEEGYRPVERKHFHGASVQRLRRSYQIKSVYQHCREQGYLTARELGQKLGITSPTVYQWQKRGLLTGHQASDKGEYLFKLPPKECWPTKAPGRTLGRREANRRGEALCQ